MRIAQITDIHLTPDDCLANEIDVWENFRKVLNHIRLLEPDCIVISGDICYEVGCLETYQEVKYLLDEVAIPYYLVAGNHDDSLQMAHVFGYETENGKIKPYQIILKNHSLHFWDSSDGLVAPYLFDDLQKNALVFVHHPLILGTCRFMDMRYSIQNIREIELTLNNCPSPIHFFHGHYHIEKYVQQNQHSFYLTPSTYFQLDDQSEAFLIASKAVGYRWIEVSDTQLMTKVVYL
jgi:Icc protein